MRRYSYYYVKPNHSNSTLDRRGIEDKRPVWKDVAVVLIVFALLVVLAIIYRRVKRLLQERKRKPRGAGSHLRSQTLRKKQTPPPNDDVEYGTYSPFDDSNRTESVYSTNMPAKPMSTYGNNSLRSFDDEQPFNQHNAWNESTDAGRMQKAHFSDSSRYSYDGFEPAGRDSAQSADEFSGRPF